MSKFEGTVHQRNVVRIIHRKVFLWYLYVSKNLAHCFLRVQLKSFESGVHEVFIKTLTNSRSLCLICHEQFDPFDTVQQMRKLVTTAYLFELLFLELLEQIKNRDSCQKTPGWYFFIVIFCQSKNREMFHYNRIGLLSSGCFVSNSVKRSFDAVDGHSHLVAVVHAYPPKTDWLDLLLKIRIHA